MKDEKGKPVAIMLADDDEDYPRLIKEAFKQLGMTNEIRRVEDGEELLDYLFRRNKYRNSSEYPLPGVIFLDLNMPRKNGLEALEEIRKSPDLRSIPVIMLTISSDKKDIRLSYTLGANSFVTKPFEFEELVQAIKNFQHYWLETAQLP
jgi:CheY-like chemotaxis protein